MQDFNTIYELMENAFPPEEYRSYTEQKALLEREDYHIHVYENQGMIAAFCAIYNLPELAFIEHIAVNEDFRGQGMGSKIMKEVITSSDKPIILEVEPPDGEENAARRVRFYEKLGFHLHDWPYEQPPLRPGEAPLPLQLMSYPHAYDIEAFGRVKDTILQNVYGI
ncbi:GNAT family N-acetyltransferase [Terribacillus saccharophilus]|uniref:Ribosomal protein S18 acetylase RimI n=1 Tax=Terribacillus saccharophilus TaxID=361277 RepID=A0AAX2EIX4_9BACI|nr:GNAT family N-acetyltransferase [Terribacillus goriensis]MEC0302531.1 GNAT family N-acetyltransferase [Terribacillus saccharophilus]SEN92985.1 Ribosomal protein S18 acetylase RimI [Terribacillus saccharophilus]